MRLITRTTAADRVSSLLPPNTLPLSGAALPVAAKSAWYTGARSPGGMLCRLSAEPRPDRQFRHRRALSRTDKPGLLSRDDRLSLADAGYLDAVPRAGIRRIVSVLFFADPGTELSRDVREGRGSFLAQFPSLATSEMQAKLADPGDIDTFRRSVLDLGERQRHAAIYALHRDQGSPITSRAISATCAPAMPPITRARRGPG
jgi:hypothetical protein